MKDKFNNQFATQKLRQNSDEEAAYLVRQKEKEKQEDERIRQLFAKHGVKPASIPPLEEEGSVTTTGGAGFTSGPVGQPAPRATKKIVRKGKSQPKERGTGKGYIFKDLWEELNENYARFKKETKIKTESQQIHAAMRLAEKKIHEANRILEYTSQLRKELAETKYSSHTHKVVERMVKSIAEAYQKIKQLR